MPQKEKQKTCLNIFPNRQIVMFSIYMEKHVHLFKLRLYSLRAHKIPFSSENKYSVNDYILKYCCKCFILQFKLKIDSGKQHKILKITSHKSVKNKRCLPYKAS